MAIIEQTTASLFLKEAVLFNSLHLDIVSYFKTSISSIILSRNKTGSGNNVYSGVTVFKWSQSLFFNPLAWQVLVKSMQHWFSQLIFLVIISRYRHKYILFLVYCSISFFCVSVNDHSSHQRYTQDTALSRQN